ncbi:GAF and ANTAR domain-containing protein [Kribbella sp. NPDC050459]|uniref:GAF and ANTAR domain-containing protein n=1 Tax=Kribbella sp. NPDC050459 TaxID=3155785 RepID=UPI0033C813D3
MSEAEYASCVTVHDLVARFVTDDNLVDALAWLTARCAESPGVTASALMLADRDGALDVVAASSAAARRLQELESRAAEGPAHDSYGSGARVDCPDLTDADNRWPRFAPAARHGDIRAVHAFPMPLPGRTIGSLTMFLSQPGALSDGSLEAGQMLASTAALGVEAHHSTQHETRADQLQGALDSRVLIEQAKGLLAERLGLGLDDAFTVLRQYARNNGRRLADVAAAVLDGTLALTAARSH